MEELPEAKNESSSSLLDQLQKKVKRGLRPTTTKTTFPDGSVHYYSAQGTSEEDQLGSGMRSYGFVVDDKPDLSIGEVTPWLYLSSQDVPNDKTIMTEHNISHVLSLLPGFKLTDDISIMIKGQLILDVYDEESFSIDSEIRKKAFQFIQSVKNENGKVLIHCNAGISRAPSMAVAYLIQCEHLTFKEAWDMVKKARPQMRPNAGFIKQLENL